ncbi:hypothetical protein BpHYR1_030279 [Brachionus plicatilis]|uniref:Uncharacterized protein n=1 Tax=Brachionus plicatilis TaxID=10195 RepID=A0A3M7SPK8_BRAPC|nr:hypothetical protein BpHYR1_030279 [Brachionus plicatilis]
MRLTLKSHLKKQIKDNKITMERPISTDAAMATENPDPNSNRLRFPFISLYKKIPQKLAIIGGPQLEIGNEIA